MDDALPRNVRVNTWHGAIQAAVINLVNPFLGINLVRLQAINLQLGLLSALPPLATCLSSLVGARVMAGRSRPKRTIAGLYLTARLALLGFVAINLARGAWRPWAFVALVFALNVPVAVANLAWQSFIGELIRGPVRAGAFAARSRAASLAGVAAVLLGGLWIRADPGVRGYVVLYGVAVFLGILEVVTFLQLRGEAWPAYPQVALGQALRRLWRATSFRRYALVVLVFYLGWTMPWPVFLRYQVSVAHATNLWVGAFTAANALSAAWASGVWGRFAGRLGAGRVLPYALILLSGVPFWYTLHPNLWGLVATNVWGGMMGAGVNLLLLVRLLDVAPREERVLAMGVNSTFAGLAGFAGPLLGVLVAQRVGMMGAFWLAASLRLLGGLIGLLFSLPGLGFAGRPGRQESLTPARIR